MKEPQAIITLGLFEAYVCHIIEGFFSIMLWIKE